MNLQSPLKFRNMRCAAAYTTNDCRLIAVWHKCPEIQCPVGLPANTAIITQIAVSVYEIL